MEEKSYCLYCGYELIVGNIALTQSNSRELNIGGTLGIHPFNVSLNPLKYNKKNETISTHPGDKCIKCLNITLIDPRTNYKPDEISIDNSTKINIGTALNHLDRNEEAIKWFDRSLEIDPNNVVANSNKGYALSKLGKYEEAIEWFNRTVEIENIMR